MIYKQEMLKKKSIQWKKIVIFQKSKMLFGQITKIKPILFMDIQNVKNISNIYTRL